MRNRPGVVLVGEGITSFSALESLLLDCEVVGLVRSGAAQDPTVAHARKHGVAVFRDASLAGLRAVVAELQPDAVVVSSYNRIVPAAMLEQRPWINVHYAPLPRYRGRATVNWAVINGEASTAITIHTMVPELDAGNILFQQPVAIGARDTVTGLYARLNDIQHRHLGATVLKRLAGDTGRVQNAADASYACTRLPDDGEIDWSGPADSADRLVRALTDPFPGAFTWLDGRKLHIHSTELPQQPRYDGSIPGRVIARDKATGTVDVLAGQGIVRLVTVSLDGTTGPASDFISSTRTTLGAGQATVQQRSTQHDTVPHAGSGAPAAPAPHQRADSLSPERL